MGLSDAEFWLSTYAKILALEDAKEVQDKRRDFFPAFLISIELNKLKGTDDKMCTPQDVLEFQYPNRAKSVNFTPSTDGPEMGASGDWKAMRDRLKGA